LKLLETVKGRFLLSSFKNETLRKFTNRNGWHTVCLKMMCSMTNRTENPRQKVEVPTANYPISVKLDERAKKEIVSEDDKD
jgi:DNA adenine methylase